MYGVICGVLAWGLLFAALLKVNHRCCWGWNVRLCALLHSFVGCRWIEYYFEWPLDHTKISTPNLPWEHTLLLFTCSYFVFDLIYCLYMQDEEHYMLVHHVLAIVISFYGYHYGICGYECALGFWITELANPLLQLRWFMQTLEWGGVAYTVVEAAFAGVFLFNRVVLGSYVAYVVIIVSDGLLLVKVGCVIMHLFNLFFASQIIGLARRKYLETFSPKVE